MPDDASLPPPPIPADTDVRDLDGFLLNTERLLASELWALATGEEFKAAVGLWCRAWKQSPPGSLPDDDRVLASFSGAGRTWKRVKKMALRGFVRCSDGRLYHPVLCADVARAAAAKKRRREQTMAASRAKSLANEHRNDSRNDDRNDRRNDRRNDSRNDSRNDDRNDLPGKGRRKEEKKESTTTRDISEPPREADSTNDKPPPAPPADAPSSSWNSPDAVRIVQAFISLRDERWPNDSRLPAPNMTLGTQAATWLKSGATPELAVEVMTRVMDAKLRDGAGPPTSLGFCTLSMDGAIATLRKAQARRATAAEPAETTGIAPLTPDWAHVAFEARSTCSPEGMAAAVAIVDAAKNGNIAERDRLVAEWRDREKQRWTRSA